MEGSEADLWESAQRNDLSRLSYLLQGDEDANQRDDRGLTPLHVAATFGAVEAAQLLLLHGADTNASDWESGWTPLHRSFYFGHVKLSLLLLKHGAKLGDEFEGDWRRDLSMNRPTNRSIRNCKDWDIHDHDGNTPLDLLCEHLKVYLQQNMDGGGQNTRKKGRAGSAATAHARAMDVCNSEVFTFGKADFQVRFLVCYAVVGDLANVQFAPGAAGHPAAQGVLRDRAPSTDRRSALASGLCVGRSEVPLDGVDSERPGVLLGPRTDWPTWPRRRARPSFPHFDCTLGSLSCFLPLATKQPCNSPARRCSGWPGQEESDQDLGWRKPLGGGDCGGRPLHLGL